MEELTQSQLKLLALCIVQKDVWDTGSSGLDQLPPQVRKLVIPYLEGQVCS